MLVKLRPRRFAVIGGQTPTVSVSVPVPTPLPQQPRRAAPAPQPVPRGGVPQTMQPAPQTGPMPQAGAVQPTQPLPSAFVFPWLPEPKQPSQARRVMARKRDTDPRAALAAPAQLSRRLPKRRLARPRRYAMNDIPILLTDSRRTPRGQGYVQDASAGGMLADALDEAGEPHAPFFRNLAHASQFTLHQTTGGPVMEYMNNPHPLRSAVAGRDQTWLLRPGGAGGKPATHVVVHRVAPGEGGRSYATHTAVLAPPALREWAAHPKVSPSLRAALTNAADHLEATAPPEKMRRANSVKLKELPRRR